MYCIILLASIRAARRILAHARGKFHLCSYNIILFCTRIASNIYTGGTTRIARKIYAARIAKKELILGNNNIYADREEAIVCTRVAKEIIVQRNLYYHSEDLLSIALHFEGP